MDQRKKYIVLTLMQSITNIYQEYLLSSADDEASSDEEHDQQRPRKRKRTTAQMSRIQSFVEYTIPGFTYTEFQTHFRLSVCAFDWLLQRISPQLKTKQIVGRPSICPKKQLLAVLWLFATPDSFRSVGSRFNMSKGTLHACYLRVLYALNSLSPTVIAWPNSEKRKIISEKFKRLSGFDGVIGAIDSTYVKIKAPSENSQVYINRECFYGIKLQAICDDNQQFINCFAGYPSSVSDTRIFRNSDIYKNIVANPEAYFSLHEYIVGDKEYVTKKFCVPPYLEGCNFSEWKRIFNHMHSKTHQVIERTFALFFGRFCRFKDLDMSRTDLIPSAIIAASVLHNICLTHSTDILRGQFEAEGALYLQERQLNYQVREQVAGPVAPTNDEGRAFRDQLAREMGLLTEQELDYLL